MIGMLRRRLMSNMAKAKNIATGTVQGSDKELIITGVGFRADHIAVLLQSNGNVRYVQTVFDDNMAYYGSNNTFTTATIPVTIDEDGVTMSINDIASYALKFVGTYRWIAWQE